MGTGHLSHFQLYRHNNGVLLSTDCPRKGAEAGLRAYGRMARLAATVVAPNGFLFTASCSHHAPADSWAAQIAHGLYRAKRDGRILFSGGAGMDHPVHPHLPETAYLKAMLLGVG